MNARRRQAYAPAALLAAVFLLSNLWLLSGGVRLGVDSRLRYLPGAESVLRGLPLTTHQATFLGYIYLVALCRYAGVGLNGVVAVQLLFSALATAALYYLGKSLGGRLAGFVAAVLLAGNPDVVRWNSYILTDSLYTSAAVLATWGIYRASVRGGYWYALASAAVLFAASVRPHGWTFIPVAGVYLIVEAPLRRRYKYWLGAGFILCASMLFAAAPLLYRGVSGNLAAATRQEGTADENLKKIISGGVVVWEYDDWRLKMPSDRPEAGETSALSYIVGHPVAVSRLAAARVLAELAHARPFYSTAHNVCVVAYLLLLYAFAAAGFVYSFREPLGRLAAAVILAHLAFVAVTWADWDGRFLTYVLPHIGLLAARGVAQGYRRLRPNSGRGQLFNKS